MHYVLFVDCDMIITSRKMSATISGNSDTVVKIVLVLLPTCTSSAKLMPWLDIYFFMSFQFAYTPEAVTTINRREIYTQPPIFRVGLNLHGDSS